jgi:WhiB family redox-sensing transcriptional regulator
VQVAALTQSVDPRALVGPGTQVPCLSYDPDVFFAESPADVEYAKALCRGCPVRADCLTGALIRQEPWGVWGGELFIQGVVVARKRPRGRPRKSDGAAEAAAQGLTGPGRALAS